MHEETETRSTCAGATIFIFMEAGAKVLNSFSTRDQGRRTWWNLQRGRCCRTSPAEIDVALDDVVGGVDTSGLLTDKGGLEDLESFGAAGAFDTIARQCPSQFQQPGGPNGYFSVKHVLAKCLSIFQTPRSGGPREPVAPGY
jgi:hypothetical protein